MKKRFRSIFGNSNSSLNTIDENTKPRPTTPAQFSVTNKNIPIKKQIVKSCSEQGFSCSNEERSKHADIKRRYKSLSDSHDIEADAVEQNFSTESSSSTESLNTMDSHFDPKLAIIRSSSVSFSSFPWLARNNRTSIARREANDIIEHVMPWLELFCARLNRNLTSERKSAGLLFFVLCYLTYIACCFFKKRGWGSSPRIFL